MVGQEDAVRRTLEHPDQIRQSRSDAEVLLFYQGSGEHRWVCAVAKRASEQSFLITAYPTDGIKEGVQIYRPKKVF